MFRARTARPPSAVDQDVSRRQSRRGGTGARGFARGAALLAGVHRLVVSIIAQVIVAGIVLVLPKVHPSNSTVCEERRGQRRRQPPRPQESEALLEAQPEPTRARRGS
jgi:hypothetical protein